MVDLFETVIGPILVIGIPALLIVIGFTIGKITERRHLADIARREALLGPMLVTDVRSYAPGASPSPQPQIVIAEVVIATDYFKTFASNLKKIIGGELRSYETMMLRARSEALLRLKEAAAGAGYNALCNLRLETADVGGLNRQGQGQAKAAMVAVLAWATAYRVG